ELAWELFDSGRVELFRRLAEKYKIPSRFFASVLVSLLKSLRREGIPVENITSNHFEEVARYLSEGKLAKEAVPEALAGIATGKYSSVEEFVREHSLSLDQLDNIIEEALSKLSDKIADRGMGAYGMVMGEVMKIVRGKIDGSIVSKRVKEKLEEFIQRS
ncbi:MAG: GatB/YqeY domain-containing protein, partial [Candidatus Korarchaeota archaeon]|nr:GatB/YqeY domain-containing protein [Candidatus Korarchaeota archaeon]